MLKIGFGKIGKSILFDNKKWGMIGGDAAPSVLLLALAELNPDITFYLIGKSDYSKLSKEDIVELVPNNNIVNVWQNSKAVNKEPDTYVLDYFNKNNIKLDYCVFLSGPSGQCTLENFMKTIKGGTTAIPLYSFKNYVGYYTRFLNETKTPYITIAEDPRYTPIKARDLIERERLILGQFNETKKIKHLRALDDHTNIHSDIQIKYSGVERITMLGATKPSFDIFTKPRSIKFQIYMNGVTDTGAEDRKKIMDEYVHKYFKDTKVYGEWDASLYGDIYKKVKMTDCVDELYDTKYTLIVPVQKGWVTSKFWKMIQYGIVPFFHKYYDSQKHLKVNEYLRVNSPEELRDKIEELEANEDLYKKIQSELYDMLKDEYYNGLDLNNIIFSELNKLGLNYEIPNFKLESKVHKKRSKVKELEGSLF